MAAGADYLAFAHTLADASGQVILPYFRSKLEVVDKAGGAGFDPVTVADQAAERTIVDRIVAAYPDHGIVGEEHGSVRGSARLRWVIDPIDGTRAFIMGLPTWGTLIALRDGDASILGLMDQPFTGERTWGDGISAHLRTARGTNSIKTRPCPTLATAVFSATHPGLFKTPRQRAILEGLSGTARLTRYGADCYGYCQLAAGHIDVIVEPGLQIYDIAALIPIIEGAGGIVTTWEGTPAIEGGDIVACGDERLHREVLALISAAR